MAARRMTINDGPKKVWVDVATWNQVQAYLAEKDAMWKTYSGLPDDDAMWVSFNDKRNTITARYRALGIFSTPEYPIALRASIMPLLLTMAGTTPCSVCGTRQSFIPEGNCALCGAA